MCDRIYTSLVHHFGTKRYKYIGNTTEYLSSRKQRVMHGGLVWGRDAPYASIHHIISATSTYIYICCLYAVWELQTRTQYRESKPREVRYMYQKRFVYKILKGKHNARYYQWSDRNWVQTSNDHASDQWLARQWSDQRKDKTNWPLSAPRHNNGYSDDNRSSVCYYARDKHFRWQ